MTNLNPDDFPFNFALLRFSDTRVHSVLNEVPGLQRPNIHTRGELHAAVSRFAHDEIGEVVTVYPKAARAHLADEADADEYSPDEKLVGLLNKIGWCPCGLEDEVDLAKVKDEARTYVYFMSRIDAPQDRGTKMLVAVEEDLRGFGKQPEFAIGQFVQIPQVGWHESEPQPDLRVVRVARTWWHHQMQLFHHQVLGTEDPFHQDTRSGVETQMWTAAEISKHRQPRFNNDKDVQVRGPDGDIRDGDLYRVVGVWWKMITEEFSYLVTKLDDGGMAVGQPEPPLRERDLMLPRPMTPESEESSAQGKTGDEAAEE